MSHRWCYWFLSPRDIIYGVADDVGGGFNADFGGVDYEVVVGRVLPFVAGVVGVVALAGFVFEADYFAGLFFREVVLVADEGYGIIFTVESLYKGCENALKKYLTDPYPIVIPVPDETSDGSYSKERIAANIKKAIGSDLI